MTKKSTFFHQVYFSLFKYNKMIKINGKHSIILVVSIDANPPNKKIITLKII